MEKWLNKIVFIFFSVILFLGLLPSKVQAETFCEERYLTLVNPVRGRSLWSNKSVSPLTDQYDLIRGKNFPATWLVQYDALEDDELLAEIKAFDPEQEIGLFLEISKDFAQDSRVTYPPLFAWANPRVVFLSGYSRSERRKMIDHLFERFNERLGYYPESVGAWWIDSYSLNYMKRKYGVKTALIVADQTTTDDFGVWGQWWGVSYYPSKTNILIPASSLKDKQDVVVLQWAQRHPDLAYGDGPGISNHSLQANDYTSLGYDTGFFSDLVDTYSDCVNSISQVTVGLETGMESVGFLGEYEKQLEALDGKEYLKPVTMAQYSESFRKMHPDIVKESMVVGDTTWEMTTFFRKNDELGDFVGYDSKAVFSDFFVSDKSEFLNRRLPELEVSRDAFLSFLNPFLFYVFSTVVLFFFILFLHLTKKPIRLAFFLALSFFLLGLVRISFLSGKYYLGLALDAFRFVGLSFGKPFEISFLNQDFYNLEYFINPHADRFLIYGVSVLLLVYYWNRLLEKK